MEFICLICGNIIDEKEKGQATLNDRKIDVCKECCENEQRKQFLDNL